MTTDIPPDWHRGKTLWTEDEMTLRDPDAERLAGAWLRLFGEELPDTSRALAEHDGGDSFATLYPNGRVAWSTYMGTAISVVPAVASMASAQRVTETPCNWERETRAVLVRALHLDPDDDRSNVELAAELAVKYQEASEENTRLRAYQATLGGPLRTGSEGPNPRGVAGELT